ncbi:MAG: hypothetical protein FJY95_00580 [Candidatus Handelsmanbacteria bacterium]|nr:hypothetical protein [Candidatus Handelsmanbacteria bacterium]
MRPTFEEGTLLLRDLAEGDPVPPPVVWDARVDHWRALATALPPGRRVPARARCLL